MSQQTVEKILNRTEAGEDEHRARINRYDKSYEVYRANAARSPRSLAPWQSQLRIPYGMQVIDTATFNIVTGKPRIIVRPRNPEDEAGAKAMQHLLDYYVAEDHLVEKQALFVQQGLIYGVSLAKNHWLYREGSKLARSFQPNPLTGENDAVVGEQSVVHRDGPTFEPWNVYDAWWTPGARSVDDADYVILRYWPSRDDLEQRRGNFIEGSLDALYSSGTRGREDSTAERHARAQERRKGRPELLEVWFRSGEMYTIGNRQVLLEAQKNPYWHGEIPIVIAQPRPDLFELQGIPFTELIDHSQQALWTTQNMRMDNLHLTVMRGFTYREGGVTDPDMLELRPRFKWGVTDHDDIKAVDIQPLPPEAYREEQEQLGRMQYITGITPYISGADMTGVDQNTATGVTALQEVASRALRFMAGQFMNKGYQRSFEMWGAMTQQFMDSTKHVKILGENGQEGWQSVSPEDVDGNYHYVLEGSEESLSRQQERGEATQLLNVMAPLVQAGLVNPKPLLERVAAAYNIPNPESLLVQPQAAPQGAPFPQQQPQQQQPSGPQLLGGQQMDPRILQAIQGGGR